MIQSAKFPGKKMDDGKNSRLNTDRFAAGDGMRLHPLVGLLFGLTFTIFGVFLLQLTRSNPADRMPAEVRNWPSVTGSVVDSVAHGSRQITYKVTVHYQVGGKSYWFQEDRVPNNIHLSEVKYDPLVPNHFYRVPLQAEAFSILIPALLVFLIGVSILFSAVSKWRSRDRSFNPITSGIVLILTIMLALAEFTYCFNPSLERSDQPKAAPYKVAEEKKPLKIKAE